jgi:hypothetical protein
VTGFVYGLSFSFVSAILVTSGLGHAVSFAHFRSLLRDHGVVPGPAAGAIAALVTVAELLIGAPFAAALIVPASRRLEVLAIVAAAALGTAFVVYLRRLLRQTPRPLSCGCSFLSGQLTRASVLPAASLVLVSLMALATTLSGDDVGFSPAADASAMLSIGWGATLGALVLAVPAAVAPRVEPEGRS